MKATVGVLVLSLFLGACSMTVVERKGEPSGQALVADSRIADCDRGTRWLTGPEDSTASAPWSGTAWTDAREWTVATTSSKAQIERDLGFGFYRNCTGAQR